MIFLWTEGLAIFDGFDARAAGFWVREGEDEVAGGGNETEDAFIGGDPFVILADLDDDGTHVEIVAHGRFGEGLCAA